MKLRDDMLKIINKIISTLLLFKLCIPVPRDVVTQNGLDKCMEETSFNSY